MDQESFRQLLATPHPGSSGPPRKSKPKGSFLTPQASTSQPSTIDPSKPAFKPRKVKKQSDSQYRDRATERRLGLASDYAGVEAVLENFEKRTADEEDREAVEEQRRYLGGDSEHSVLVKGLDYALLEQNKARAAASTEDDDVLEDAFVAASTTAIPVPASTVPQKRSRTDLMKELREKRSKKEGSMSTVTANGTVDVKDVHIEEAKKAGKFKPIGFKPITEPSGKSKKVQEGKDKDGVRKKKKRKVAESSEAVPTMGKQLNPVAKADAAKNLNDALLPPQTSSETASGPFSVIKSALETEAGDADVDIFAGAGDYEGIDFGDDGEEDEVLPSTEAIVDEPMPMQPRRWFDDEEPPPIPRSPTPPPASTSQIDRKPRSPGGHEREEGEEEPEAPARLVPLASSALPSIKDILAVDSALEAEQKRKARKLKGKGEKGDGEGKKTTTEAKINRDYQRLKSWTDKRAGASGSA